ncbi:MAG: hypothetical protein RLZ25_1229 [Pseudomonadota bacterium]|jgi:hypothetical protein
MIYFRQLPLLFVLMLSVTFAVGFSQTVAAADVKLTVYNKIMSSTNISMSGAAQRQMGDGFAAHMNVYRTSDVGQLPIATADFSLLITVPASASNPIETRLYHAVFTFNPDDSIIIDGISIAEMPDNWMNTSPSARAVTGGTGKYRGAKGTAIFTRIEQNLFKMDLKFKTN